jgi:hypothetical protein
MEHLGKALASGARVCLTELILSGTLTPPVQFCENVLPSFVTAVGR